jgi:hypothetical protein
VLSTAELSGLSAHLPARIMLHVGTGCAYVCMCAHEPRASERVLGIGHVKSNGPLEVCHSMVFLSQTWSSLVWHHKLPILHSLDVPSMPLLTATSALSTTWSAALRYWRSTQYCTNFVSVQCTAFACHSGVLCTLMTTLAEAHTCSQCGDMLGHLWL